MGPAIYGNEPQRPPDIGGQGGRAWRLEAKPVGQRARADMDGTLTTWMVNAPQSHPIWTWYLISAIHLRDIPGVKPAIVVKPGNTHEIMFFALNPEKPLPGLVVDETFKPSLLRPYDLVHQFPAANDAIADEILMLVIRTIADGLIMPDVDNRRAWERAIDDTARHYATGKHKVTVN